MTNKLASVPTAQPRMLLQETNAVVEAVPAGGGGSQNSADPISVRQSTADSRRPDAICLGVPQSAGQDHQVCIPADIRERSTHIVSSAGMGMTSLMMNMLLQDIEANRGAVFMDFCGDATGSLLSCIGRHHWPRVIHFNPGDTEWIPLWNPISLPPGGDPYRLADDVVSIFRHVSHDLQDRTEHLLRCACIGLQHIPNQCLLDVFNLLRQKTPESDQLRERILAAVQDEHIKKFFQTDYPKYYTKSDVQTPEHRVAKLLSAGSVSLMLSQPQSLINFRTIMDKGDILLVDLSSLGADQREILGSFILTLFLMAATSRSDTEITGRRPFSMFVDEAHLFVSGDAIENIITQARRFHVNISLAHQYLKQFHTATIETLSTVGCTIIGRLDKNDSHFFANTLQGKVKPDDIMSLERYEMIARIGSEIVRFKTLPPPAPRDGCNGGEIVEESRRRYCRPAAEVRLMIAKRSRDLYEPARGRLPLHMC